MGDEARDTARADAPQGAAARIPYLPALDGLRGLAVAGVLLYHAGVGLGGGFLGVESFFVLSGFLITALLLAEWRATGGVDLRSFWLRRARRLLPALAVVLLATLAAGALLLPDETAELGADALAALAYVMNWRLVLGERSYFDAAERPPLLQHLWSLAVEEQFYLIWPPLFLLGVRALGPRRLALALLAAAGAAAALMAQLYEPGADPSRIYYGTDTRAAGLLLGSALAFVWLPGRVPAAGSARAGLVLDAVGLAALAGLGAAYAQLVEQHPLLYRGGFALVALATAAVVAAATHPRARLLPRLLGLGPLRWVGERSYGIYLWHWPIFSLTRPGLDVPLDGPALHALRIGAAVVLAALSYRFVEQPVCRGALDALWRRLPRPSLPALGWPNRRAAASLLVVLPLSSAMCAAPVPQQAPADTPLPTLVTAVSLADLTARPAALTPALSDDPSPTVAPPTIAPPTSTPPAAEPSPTSPRPAAEQPLAGDALAEVEPELAAALQRVLDEAVADGAIPGAVASVSIPGYRTWSGAAGVADRREGTPMTPDTRVRIASVSKMFTAVVVLQLAEEGVVELDAPMSTWLPDLVPGGEAITVRELLSHTTGLYDYLEDRSFVNGAYREPDRARAPEELVAYATQFPPAFPAGSAGNWDYSSTNYVILGLIVERATGKSLAEEMRRRIFDPLELSGTFFAPAEPVEGPYARGYSKTTDQTNVAMSMVFGTASIVSTVADVVRFGRALFDGELLRPETLDQMLTFRSGKGQYNMPSLEYGLGVMRNVLPVGPGLDGAAYPDSAATVMGHIGGFGGFRSALWHAPESGVTVAMGVNQASMDPNTLATRLLGAVLDHRSALAR